MTDNLLKPLRKEIDDIDVKILNLLNQRAEVAISIGNLKKENSVAVFDSHREKTVLNKIAMLSEEKAITPAASKVIFTEIIKACRAAQAPVRVAFLGPLGTFSHAAALQQFGSLAQYKLCANFAEIFKMVQADNADFALVPFENSTEGIVGQTLDLIAINKLKASTMFSFKVTLSLMTNNSDLKNIKKVASHPQALAQCRGWLSLNLPGVEILSTSSTASAASLALKDETIAVVGHPSLASFYDLQIVVEKIEDYSHNQTCFLVLGNENTKASGKDRTLICFATKHKSGSLYECLQPIADANVNMTRLHSRPNRNSPWEYLFFLEVEGHYEDPIIKEAIINLEKYTESLNIVGSYPDITENSDNNATSIKSQANNYNQF